MPGRRRAVAVGLAIAALCLVIVVIGRRHRSEPPVPTETLNWDALPGFAADDLVAALRVFARSCRRRVAPLLARACHDLPDTIGSAPAAEAFFRSHFAPRRIAAPGFFTGYFEPVVAAALTPSPGFDIPLRAAPPNLVTVSPGKTPGLDPALTAALREPDGRLVALPDRAGIERGALASAPPLAYVARRDVAFFIQVQGSARLRLADGRLRRLVYAGRNGYPYTAIGKVLANRLHLPPARVTMTFLRDWISSHGEGEADEGTALMRANRSYIFFRFDDPPGGGGPSDVGSGDVGPLGGAEVPLTASRSLAVDHAIWTYGLPFFVDARLPDQAPFQHLLIAQDTGAAIKGPARGDIFFGTGDAAGEKAGAMRSAGTLTVLWPKGAP